MNVCPILWHKLFYW